MVAEQSLTEHYKTWTEANRSKLSTRLRLTSDHTAQAGRGGRKNPKKRTAQHLWNARHTCLTCQTPCMWSRKHPIDFKTTAMHALCSYIIWKSVTFQGWPLPGKWLTSVIWWEELFLFTFALLSSSVQIFVQIERSHNLGKMSGTILNSKRKRKWQKKHANAIKIIELKYHMVCKDPGPN